MNKRVSFIGIYIVSSVSLALLFIIGLCLKMTGVVDVSWWWVSSPIWLPTLIFCVCFCFSISYLSLKEHFEKNKYISKDIYE